MDRSWPYQNPNQSDSPPRETILLRHVEPTCSSQRIDEDSDEFTNEKPWFRTNLANQTIVEGDRAQFDARLWPLGDQKMKVIWYHNGQPLAISSRYLTRISFGYVSLTILNINRSDAGVYVCRAVNDLGEATSTANLTVRPPSPKFRAPFGYDDEFESIERIRHLEDSEFYSRQESIEESYSYGSPEFVKHLVNLDQAYENGQARFEARIEPGSDPSLQVEWYKNGKLLNLGKWLWLS